MSERKVLNKYYPPDFDPSKIPKGKRNKNATFNIRIMAPFNMRCNMCKDYIYKGKKFNSRKEDVMDEDYLGLKIFRFYIKCPRCVSEIAFKTDLLNTDYTLEAGATRLFEAEKLAIKMAEAERKEKEEDEMNPMKVLENRTKNSRMEMDQIDSLEELREMNTRKNTVNTDEMIEKYRKYEQTLAQLQIEAEEKEIQEIFGDKCTKVVKRLHDSDSDDDGPTEKKVAVAVCSTSTKPTDILAEEPKETKPKVTKSWERSVGSMSSQNKLKGLIVKKKGPLPVVKSTVPNNSDKANITKLNSDLPTSGAKSCDISAEGNTEAHVNSANEIGNRDGGSTHNDAQHSNISENDRNSDKDLKAEDKTSKNSGSEKVKAIAKTAVQTSAVGIGSLGLLGNYTDSESENSD